jgi:hypothetical protein
MIRTVLRSANIAAFTFAVLVSFAASTANGASPVSLRATTVDCGMLVDWIYHGFFYDEYWHGGSGYPGTLDPDDPNSDWENNGGGYYADYHSDLSGGTIAYDGHGAC